MKMIVQLEIPQYQELLRLAKETQKKCREAVNYYSNVETPDASVEKMHKLRVEDFNEELAFWNSIELSLNIAERSE